MRRQRVKHSTNGGIVDPPVLDVVNGFVYSQSVNTTTPVVVQASINNLATNSTASLVGPMTFNMHAPAFNDAYFTDPTSTDWLIYDYSSDDGTGGGNLSGGAAEFVLWGIGFSPSHVMNSGTPPVGPFPGTATNAIPFNVGAPGQFEISPVTEFLTTGVEDRIFASALGAFPVAGNVVSFDVNDTLVNPGGSPPGQVPGFPIGGGTGVIENSITEGQGTSGIVIDNDSAGVTDANSLYFGVAGSGPNTLSVVKLTQAGFN